MDQPVEERTEHTSTFYIVEAECVDEAGATVIRQLGEVRGMTDNGYPAWTKVGKGRIGGTRFSTLEKASEAARHPHSWSAYDSHYRGGAVRVKEITEQVVTIRRVVAREIGPV